MNYLHWRCHLSFLDVYPQIIPAKKAWETRLNFPAVSSGWREKYETILKEPESGRDTIHTYPTEIRSSGTTSHRRNKLRNKRNKLLRYISCSFFWIGPEFSLEWPHASCKKKTGSEVYQDAVRSHWRESCAIERGKIVCMTSWKHRFVGFSLGKKMPADRKPMRFAHSEGHTDVCYDEKGE